jgi:DNA-binding NarL/FixJ family response regulator
MIRVQVLLIGDQPNLVKDWQEHWQQDKDMVIHTALTEEEAIEKFQLQQYDAVVINTSAQTINADKLVKLFQIQQAQIAIIESADLVSTAAIRKAIDKTWIQERSNIQITDDALKNAHFNITLN